MYLPLAIGDSNALSLEDVWPNKAKESKLRLDVRPVGDYDTRTVSTRLFFLGERWPTQGRRHREESRPYLSLSKPGWPREARGSLDSQALHAVKST